MTSGSGGAAAAGVRNEPIIVTDDGLGRLAERLAQEPVIAFDLEADSLHHYRERVCLIQIAIPGASLLVDPLAIDDLSPLAPVLADPAVKKVMHGADYDIRSLHRDFGIQVANLFDTMIACQFLGEKELGLAAVLRNRFGAELDKRFQKADWSRRPLTEEMLDYARKDVTLLIPLLGQLEKELRDKGRLDWVEEECELLCGVRSTVRDGDEPLFLRFKGAAKMNPRSLAVLEELLLYRETAAEKADIPPFKILGNDTLRELAEKKPERFDALEGIPGLSPRLMERHGRRLLTAIRNGLHLPAAQLPRYPFVAREKRPPAAEERLKRLKAWREERSKTIGMDPGILANNALLESLADNPPAGPAAMELVAGLKRWQRQEFGTELLELVR